MCYGLEMLEMMSGISCNVHLDDLTLRPNHCILYLLAYNITTKNKTADSIDILDILKSSSGNGYYGIAQVRISEA